MAYQTPHVYLDALLAAIPHETVPPEIATASRDPQASSHSYPKFLDAALRLATGGPARPDDAPHLRAAWPEIQASLQQAFHALHPSSEPPTKRRRSPSPQQQQQQHHAHSLPTNNKKPKHDIGEGGDDNGDDDAEDAPHLTIHALSATAPVRHKVDVTLHAHTLRLAHSGTGARVARCARTALTRAFLLPTRARSSGALQWTVLLLAGDKPAPPTARGGGRNKNRASAANANAAGGVRFELTCSAPEAGAPPRMTVHHHLSASTSTSASSSHPPPSSSSTREAFLALLAPITLLKTVERGTLLAGITAFRGVRETSLWFFDAGILADARPAEFWALADLARGEAGVRVRTATGRTCSAVLMRRPSPSSENNENPEEEEEEGEETEFQSIDGKERERILEWVRRHRDAFGIVDVPSVAAAAAAAEAEGEVEGEEGKEGEAGAATRGDSDSDSDFEVSSGSSDGGSSSSSSSSSSSASGDGAGDDEDEGSQQSALECGESDDGDDEEEEVELDPKRHPLLRAGELPKMSRAAMDAAVGLVVDDLVGRTVGGPGPPPHASVQVQDDGEDEEDELDD